MLPASFLCCPGHRSSRKTSFSSLISHLSMSWLSLAVVSLLASTFPTVSNCEAYPHLSSPSSLTVPRRPSPSLAVPLGVDRHPHGLDYIADDEIRQVEGFKNVSLGNVLSSGYKGDKNSMTFLSDSDKASRPAPGAW